MPLTTAYAGHGTITPENAAGLLNEFLPDDAADGTPGLGLVIIPQRVTRRQAGLKHAIAWLETELGPDSTIPTDDIVTALVARRDEEGDDLALVMAYDPDVKEDSDLAVAAHEAGIRVVDLCAANDDLLLDDAEITFAEGGEVPAAEDETPPFEGGVKLPEGVSQDPRTGIISGTPTGAAEPVKEAVERATKAGTEAALAHGVITANPKSASLDAGVFDSTPGITFTLTLPQEAITALAKALADEFKNPAAEAVSVAPEPEEKLATVTDINGSATQQPGTKAYYYNADKVTYRPARGQARSGEEKVFLTEEGVRQITQRKLLA